MKIAVHAPQAFACFNDEHFHCAWFFKAKDIAYQVDRGPKHEQYFKGLEIDKTHQAYHRVDYEKHVAYAQHHGGAGEALE